ncbi:MAG TPA: hypothetical protein VKY59_14755 [Spirillospora sp.]|nr:hypothetical protein [Spirillospora sp.]
MSDQFNEYYLREYLNARRSRLMDEARKERLRNEVLAAARRQKQPRRISSGFLAGLWNILQAAVQPSSQRSTPRRDHTSLESPAS